MNAVSEFNQRACELFGRPLVQGFANEYGAKLARLFHPLRLQRWAFSDLNPATWWLAPAAEAVKANRKALPPTVPARKAEAMASELVSASLDCQRSLRDAAGEAAFFETYGNLSAFYFGTQPEATTPALATDPRQLSFVRRRWRRSTRAGTPKRWPASAS